MSDNKLDMILLIFKIILTSVMMLVLSLIEPVFGYIWCGALLIAVPICLTFAFIGRRDRK